MSFLDRLKSIAGKGMLPHDVLVAMALKALPMEFTNRLVVAPGGVTWESLYESCSVWEATGLEGKENNFQCFSNRSGGGYSAKRENFSNFKTKKNLNIQCYFCEKVGHRLKDCFKLQEMKNQKVKKAFSIKKLNESEEGEQGDNNKFNECYLLENLKIIENFNIEININGLPVSAIYDTGSDLSLLDSRIIKDLEIIETNKKIIAANNSFLNVLGETNLIDVKIKNLNKKMAAKFIVIKNLNRQCILGKDFMRDNKIKLCVNNDEKNKSIGVHEILTENSTAVATRYRRYSEFENEEIEKQVAEWLNKGIVRTSSSPWRSPLVVVSKKDGGKRICNDYRKLNSITKKDGYPLAWIEEIFDALAGATIFSKMDAKSGYHQIDLAERDKEKTAFSCKLGTFEYNKMPFGLVNAPAIFQRVMDNILKPYLWKFVVVYLDDIIVYSRTPQEHEAHLKTVKDLLNRKGLVLNDKKCEYRKPEIEILGHIISEKGTRPLPHRIEAIKNFKLPDTKKKLQSYLGLVNYCRKFIKNLSIIANPLFALLKKNLPIKEFREKILGEECSRCFARINEEISKTTICSFANKEGKFVLTTDASNVGVGAVLSQIQENKDTLISFYSSTFSEAEKHYSTTEQELLAVVKAVKHFRHYLLNKRFTVKTDHMALTFLRIYKDNNQRIFRWSLFLQDYSFDVEHIKGNSNFSDVLSRNF